MSLAIAHSRAALGVKALPVTVEAHIFSGLPKFSIVGLPETVVKESKDRVRSALMNSQFHFPARRITVNLAPADLPKEGGRFDLPIAISILAALDYIPRHRLEEYEFAGELTLSGEVRAIHGSLPLALQVVKENKKLILPYDNAQEAALAKGDVFVAKHLLDVCKHLRGEATLPRCPDHVTSNEVIAEKDLQDVIGQQQAKRALEVAAAGGHSLLMVGPPGTGKTLLASCLPTILPEISIEQALDVAAVYSISKPGFSMQHWRQRPWRAPHHTTSSVALVGGGNPPRPGEISLAHHGVLFLDELPEFQRSVLETLREPLESGTIMISRAARQAQFPAQFQLIAAMNPCPCGQLANPQGQCRCTDAQIHIPLSDDGECNPTQLIY